MLGREDTEGPEGNLISSKLTPLRLFHGSSVAQTAKNLLAMRETQIQALGQEDCLEKGKATHSSILVWRMSWTEKPLWVTLHMVAKSWTQLSN